MEARPAPLTHSVSIRSTWWTAEPDIWIASCETVYRLCPIRPERVASPLLSSPLFSSLLLVSPRLVSRRARGPATGDHVFASESEFPDDDWIIDETNTYAQCNLTSRISPRDTSSADDDAPSAHAHIHRSLFLVSCAARKDRWQTGGCLGTMGFNWTVCYANYDIKSRVILAKDFIKSRRVRYLLIVLLLCKIIEEVDHPF